MLVIRFIVLIFIIQITNFYASEKELNPYNFLLKEILLGEAKKNLVKDRFSIPNKKALSYYEDEEGKAIKIELATKFKGSPDDWSSKNQRWELGSNKNPAGLISLNEPVFIKYTFKLSSLANHKNIDGTFFQITGNKRGTAGAVHKVYPWISLRYDYEDDKKSHNYLLDLKYLNLKDHKYRNSISYKFDLLTDSGLSVADNEFERFQTYDFKIIPSDNEDGEIIVWKNGKVMLQLYGRNYWEAHAFGFRVGHYRWLEDWKGNINKAPNAYTIIKEFGYSSDCLEILSTDQCEWKPYKNKRKSRSKFEFRVSNKGNPPSFEEIIKYYKKY